MAVTALLYLWLVPFQVSDKSNKDCDKRSIMNHIVIIRLLQAVVLSVTN
jgi:hypothetical protein